MKQLKAKTREQAVEFFWARVHRPISDECWNWTKGKNSFGYGVLKSKWFKETFAHRVAYEIAVSPIPENGCILHRCDNPSCCNPLHLYVGDRIDNVIDREARGRGGDHRGRLNGRAKLTDEQVAWIRTEYGKLPRGQRLAAAQSMNVTVGNVYHVLHGRTWQ